MNDAYDDPFLPLPSLPDSTPAQPANCVSAKEDGHGGFDFGGNGTEMYKDYGNLDLNFDDDSLEDNLMLSDDDFSDESDIEDDDHIVGKSMFEPINIFKKDSLAAGKNSGAEQNCFTEIHRGGEDSLSALPVISTTSSVKGFGNGYPYSVSEHATSLSAASYNSGANSEDNGTGTGYSSYAHYSRPKPYTLRRPSYARSENLWDAQSAHSAHSVHSTQSAPILSAYRDGTMQNLYTSQSVASMQNQKPQNVTGFTENTTTRTVSSSCNEGGGEASETYSFYSRPKSYTLRRPSYVQSAVEDSSYLSHYNVNAPDFMEEETNDEAMLEISETRNIPAANMNQLPGINQFMNSIDYKKSNEPLNSLSYMPNNPLASTVFSSEKTADSISCKSMPATVPSANTMSGFAFPQNAQQDSIKDDIDMRPAAPVEPSEMKEVPKVTEEAIPQTRFQLVVEDDKGLATQFSHAVLSEYGPTVFKNSDRQGKRKGLSEGFPGISCLHCNGSLKKGGRFFPSTIKTMADTKKTLISIHNHLLKCQNCPDEVREKLVRLKGLHEIERQGQKYGSQKAFFTRIWTRLHGDKK